MQQQTASAFQQTSSTLFYWAKPAAVEFAVLTLQVFPVPQVYREHAGATIGILPKIESADSVGHLADILDAADGAMVARGDLGAELPVQEVSLAAVA